MGAPGDPYLPFAPLASIGVLPTLIATSGWHLAPLAARSAHRTIERQLVKTALRIFSYLNPYWRRMVVVYVALQRRFIEGMLGGAVKE